MFPTESITYMVNNKRMKGDRVMSQEISMFSQVNGTQDFTTLNVSKSNLASDDVHRIAMRSPALYQTNSVPQVPRPTIFDNFERGEL